MRKPTAKALRRMEILKDAIAQVRSNRYKATTGLYVDLNNLQGVSDNCTIEQVAKGLDERNRSEYCKVCADGALLISSLRKGEEARDIMNNVVKAHYANAATNNVLRKNRTFTWKQVKLMEAYFENRQMQSGVSQELIEAWNEDKGYKTPRQRMLGIFQNALENNGIFKP